jgi:hypothetical protein
VHYPYYIINNCFQDDENQSDIIVLPRTSNNIYLNSLTFEWDTYDKTNYTDGTISKDNGVGNGTVCI